MKKLAIIILILFISCDGTKTTKHKNYNVRNSPEKVKDIAVSVNDTADTVVNTAPADPVLWIKRHVEHINTAQLQKKHIEFMCDEKMIVDYFYENGELVKVSVDFATIGDVYAKEDYYYNAGKLIFNYEYVKGGPACQGCITSNEYRSYVRNGAVIKYLKNKNEAKCRRCVFGPATKQFKLLKTKTAAEAKKVLCG